MTLFLLNSELPYELFYQTRWIEIPNREGVYIRMVDKDENPTIKIRPNARPAISDKWNPEQQARLEAQWQRFQQFTQLATGHDPLEVALSHPDVHASLMAGTLPLGPTAKAGETAAEQAINKFEREQKIRKLENFRTLDSEHLAGQADPNWMQRAEKRMDRIQQAEAYRANAENFITALANNSGMDVDEVRKRIGVLSDQQLKSTNRNHVNIVQAAGGSGKSQAAGAWAIKNSHDNLSASDSLYVSGTHNALNVMRGVLEKVRPFLSPYDQERLDKREKPTPTQPEGRPAFNVRTPWSAALYDLKRTVHRQGQDKYNALDLLDKGKYANYALMGFASNKRDLRNVPFSRLGDDDVTNDQGGESAATGQTKFVNSMYSHFDLNHSVVHPNAAIEYINKTKQEHEHDSPEYKQLLEKGKNLWKSGDRDNYQAIHWAYEQAKEQKTVDGQNFTIPGYATPMMDPEDTLHLATRAARELKGPGGEKLFSPFKTVWGDELQNFTNSQMRYFAARTNQNSRILFSGDMGQKTIANNNDVPVYIYNAFTKGDHANGNIASYAFTGNYRQGIGGSSVQAAIGADLSLKNIPGKSPSSVSMSGHFEGFPEISYGKTYEEAFRPRIEKWFEQQWITPQQVMRNIEERPTEPALRGALAPGQAPFIFEMNEQRAKFERELVNYMSDQLGSPEKGALAVSRMLSKDHPTSKNESQMRALTVPQSLGMSFGAPQIDPAIGPTLDVTRSGAWNFGEYLQQLQIMAGRASGRQYWIGTGVQSGETEHDLSPEKFKKTMMPIVSRMVNYAVNNEGLSKKQVPEELRYLLKNPYVVNAKGDTPLDVSEDAQRFVQAYQQATGASGAGDINDPAYQNNVLGLFQDATAHNLIQTSAGGSEFFFDGDEAADALQFSEDPNGVQAIEGYSIGTLDRGTVTNRRGSGVDMQKIHLTDTILRDIIQGGPEVAARYGFEEGTIPDVLAIMAGLGKPGEDWNEKNIVAPSNEERLAIMAKRNEYVAEQRRDIQNIRNEKMNGMNYDKQTDAEKVWNRKESWTEGMDDVTYNNEKEARDLLSKAMQRESFRSQTAGRELLQEHFENPQFLLDLQEMANAYGLASPFRNVKMQLLPSQIDMLVKAHKEEQNATWDKQILAAAGLGEASKHPAMDPNWRKEQEAIFADENRKHYENAGGGEATIALIKQALTARQEQKRYEQLAKKYVGKSRSENEKRMDMEAMANKHRITSQNIMRDLLGNANLVGKFKNAALTFLDNPGMREDRDNQQIQKEIWQQAGKRASRVMQPEQIDRFIDVAQHLANPELYEQEKARIYEANGHNDKDPELLRLQQEYDAAMKYAGFTYTIKDKKGKEKQTTIQEQFAIEAKRIESLMPNQATHTFDEAEGEWTRMPVKYSPEYHQWLEQHDPEQAAINKYALSLPVQEQKDARGKITKVTKMDGPVDVSAQRVATDRTIFNSATVAQQEDPTNVGYTYGEGRYTGLQTFFQRYFQAFQNTGNAEKDQPGGGAYDPMNPGNRVELAILQKRLREEAQPGLPQFREALQQHRAQIAHIKENSENVGARLAEKPENIGLQKLQADYKEQIASHEKAIETLKAQQKQRLQGLVPVIRQKRAQAARIGQWRAHMNNRETARRYSHTAYHIMNASVGGRSNTPGAIQQSEQFFFSNLMNQYAPNTRTLGSLGEVLGAMERATNHLQQTGTLKREHINKVLAAFGHNPDSEKFAGLRRLEQKQNFRGPDDTISLKQLLNLYSTIGDNENQSDRERVMSAFTKQPFRPGDQVVFRGQTVGDLTQNGLKDGMRGTIHALPLFEGDQWKEVKKQLDAGQAVDYTKFYREGDELKRFNAPRGFGSMQKMRLHTQPEVDEINRLYKNDPAILAGKQSITEKGTGLVYLFKGENGQQFPVRHDQLELLNNGSVEGDIPFNLPYFAGSNVVQKSNVPVSREDLISDQRPKGTTFGERFPTLGEKEEELDRNYFTEGRKHTPKEESPFLFSSLMEDFAEMLEHAQKARERPQRSNVPLVNRLNDLLPKHLRGRLKGGDKAPYLSRFNRDKDFSALQNPALPKEWTDDEEANKVRLGHIRDLSRNMYRKVRRYSIRPNEEGDPTLFRRMRHTTRVMRDAQRPPTRKDFQAAFNGIHPSLVLRDWQAGLNSEINALSENVRGQRNYASIQSGLNAITSEPDKMQAIAQGHGRLLQVAQQLKGHLSHLIQPQEAPQEAERLDTSPLRRSDQGLANLQMFGSHIQSLRNMMRPWVMRPTFEQVKAMNGGKMPPKLAPELKDRLAATQDPSLFPNPEEINSIQPEQIDAGRGNGLLDRVQNLRERIGQATARMRGQSGGATTQRQAQGDTAAAADADASSLARWRYRPILPEPLALPQEAQSLAHLRHLDSLSSRFPPLPTSPVLEPESVFHPSSALLGQSNSLLQTIGQLQPPELPAPAFRPTSALLGQSNAMLQTMGQLQPPELAQPAFRPSSALLGTSNSLLQTIGQMKPPKLARPSEEQLTPPGTSASSSEDVPDPGEQLPVDPPTLEAVKADIARFATEGYAQHGIMKPTSDEQLPAILDDQQAKLIRGGPGGGKTATAVSAAMYAMAKDPTMVPRDILAVGALTSAKTALDEKLGNFVKAMPNEEQYKTQARTFHSMGHGILFKKYEDPATNRFIYPTLNALGMDGYSPEVLEQKNQEELDRLTPEQQKIANQNSQAQFVLDALKDAHAQNHFTTEPTLARAKRSINEFSKWQKQRLSEDDPLYGTKSDIYTEKWKEGVEHLSKGKLSDQAIFVAYNQGKELKKRVDHDDVMFKANRALEIMGEEAVPDNLQNTRMMIVDEGQDLTAHNKKFTQNYLNAIGKNNPQLIVAYDTAQSQMENLGGYKTNDVIPHLKDMARKGTGADPWNYTLTWNHRSDPNVVAGLNALLDDTHLKNETVSPKQRPAIRTIGKPMRVTMRKSQPALYTQMARDMIKKTGVPVTTIKENLLAGRMAFHGVDFSQPGLLSPVNEELHPNIAGIVSMNKQQSLFHRATRDMMMNEWGMTKKQADQHSRQLFRNGPLPRDATDREKELAKHQLPLLKMAQARSLGFQESFVDVTQVGEWQKDPNYASFVRNAFIGESRELAGGQNHIYAASYPFTAAQTDAYLQTQPGQGFREENIDDPVNGGVYLNGQAIRDKPEPHNDPQKVNGQWMPPILARHEKEAQAQLQEWIKQGLVDAPHGQKPQPNTEAAEVSSPVSEMGSTPTSVQMPQVGSTTVETGGNVSPESQVTTGGDVVPRATSSSSGQSGSASPQPTDTTGGNAPQAGSGQMPMGGGGGSSSGASESATAEPTKTSSSSTRNTLFSRPPAPPAIPYGKRALRNAVNHPDYFKQLDEHAQYIKAFGDYDKQWQAKGKAKLSRQEIAEYDKTLSQHKFYLRRAAPFLGVEPRDLSFLKKSEASLEDQHAIYLKKIEEKKGTNRGDRLDIKKSPSLPPPPSQSAETPSPQQSAGTPPPPRNPETMPDGDPVMEARWPIPPSRQGPPIGRPPVEPLEVVRTSTPPPRLNGDLTKLFSAPTTHVAASSSIDEERILRPLTEEDWKAHNPKPPTPLLGDADTPVSPPTPATHGDQFAATTVFKRPEYRKSKIPGDKNLSWIPDFDQDQYKGWGRLGPGYTHNSVGNNNAVPIKIDKAEIEAGAVTFKGGVPAGPHTGTSPASPTSPTSSTSGSGGSGSGGGGGGKKKKKKNSSGDDEEPEETEEQKAKRLKKERTNKNRSAVRQVGHEMARIGGELQFIGVGAEQLTDSAAAQGGAYRRATLLNGGGGVTGTEGNFDFNNPKAGINRLQAQLPMFSKTQIAQQIQSVTSSANSTNVPGYNADNPTRTILGLSALTGLSNTELTNQLMAITGSAGQGKNSNAVTQIGDQLNTMYNGNLSAQNVGPTLTALQSILPTMGGINLGGKDQTKDILGLFSIATHGNMTAQNLPQVAQTLGTLSQIGTTPDLQQQHFLQQLFPKETLTAAPEMAQYQSQRSDEMQQVAQLQLRKTYDAEGMQISINNAEIKMEKANLDMGGIQLQSQQTQLQGAQMQQDYNVASYNLKQSQDTAMYGNIGQDTSRTGYFNFMRSQQAAGYNATSPENSQYFKAGNTFGVENAKFYAGVEHQRSDMVLGRSSLLSDAKFNENMKYLNQQETFYNEELKLRNEQRSFERDWTKRLLDQQQKSLDIQQKVLDQQKVIYDLQKERYGLDVARNDYENASLELQKQYLPQQIENLKALIRSNDARLNGQGPMNGGFKTPQEIIKQLSGVKDDKQLTSLIAQATPDLGERKTLYEMIKAIQKSPAFAHGGYDAVMKSNTKDDKKLQDKVNSLNNQGAFIDWKALADAANAFLSFAGEGKNWDNLVTSFTKTADALQAIAEILAPLAPFLKMIAPAAPVGAGLMAGATAVNTAALFAPNLIPSVGNLIGTGLTTIGGGSLLAGGAVAGGALLDIAGGAYGFMDYNRNRDLLNQGGLNGWDVAKQAIPMYGVGQTVHKGWDLISDPNARGQYGDAWQKNVWGPLGDWFQKHPAGAPSSSNNGNLLASTTGNGPDGGAMILGQGKSIDWGKIGQQMQDNWNSNFGPKSPISIFFNKTIPQGWNGLIGTMGANWNSNFGPKSPIGILFNKTIPDNWNGLIGTMGANWNSNFGPKSPIGKTWNGFIESAKKVIDQGGQNWNDFWQKTLPKWWDDRVKEWKDGIKELPNLPGNIINAFKDGIKNFLNIPKGQSLFGTFEDSIKGLFGLPKGKSLWQSIQDNMGNMFNWGGGGNNGGGHQGGGDFGGGSGAPENFDGITVPHINTQFGEQLWYGKHQGIDFAAAQGTPLREFVGGKVTAAGFHPWGGEVDVALPGGMTERYLHLSALLAHPGQMLPRGAMVGLTGGGTSQSGLGYWSHGSHLHWQLDKGDINHGVNPWPYLHLYGENNVWRMLGASVSGRGRGGAGGFGLDLKPGQKMPQTEDEIKALIADQQNEKEKAQAQFSKGGVAMRRMTVDVAEVEPEAIIPLSRLIQTLSQIAAPSSRQTEALAQPVAKQPTQVTVSKLAEKFELHVHTSATSLDEQAKDALMAQLLDILGDTLTKFNGGQG